MNFSGLRSFALALFVATTGASLCSVVVPVAEAAGVRPQVGKPLQAAIALANRGNASAAMSAVRQARSVSGLTGSEQAAIAQTKQFIAAKTGNFAGGGGSGTGRARKICR